MPGPRTHMLDKKMHPMHPGSNKEVILFAGFHDLGEQFDDTIFTNGTGIIEVLSDQCGGPLMKPHCIHCCIQTSECNVAYIAYKNGSNLVDWCQLYNLGDIDLLSATNSSIVPEYWVQKWMENGGQPTKSELAVFGKNVLKYLFLLVVFICTHEHIRSNNIKHTSKIFEVTFLLMKGPQIREQ